MPKIKNILCRIDMMQSSDEIPGNVTPKVDPAAQESGVAAVGKMELLPCEQCTLTTTLPSTQGGSGETLDVAKNDNLD